MADQLILGGITFDDYSTPSRMGAGGRQALVVHKLPGGSRVIDQLGPDEGDISWQGEFFDDNAYQTALTLDGMRAAGAVTFLTFGGQQRTVIIESFRYRIRRLPMWVEYEINCTVVVNPGLGPLPSIVSSSDTLITTDLAQASAQGGISFPSGSLG